MELLWTCGAVPTVLRAANRGAGVGVAEPSPADASSTRSTRRAAEVAPQVLCAARDGDHQAFAAIVEHYDDRLRALAFHVLHDREATRDALQDAYLKAYLGLPAFRGESGLATWLYRIVYTTCLNHLRSGARGAALDVPSDVAGDHVAGPSGEVGGDPADEVPGAVDLAALIHTLSPEQRAAVVLVDAQGLGYARTAEILGIPQGTVASRVASARAKLRRVLADGDDASAGTEREETP